MVVQSTQQPVELYVPRDGTWSRGLTPRDSPGAAWLLNLLHWKLICWRADPDGYVRLKCEYLRRVIPKNSLGKIRNKLAESGVIDLDRSYVKGQKSMRYRLRDQYRRTCVFDCIDRRLCKRVRELQRESPKPLPVHEWLSDRLTLLEFDRQNAESIISGMYPDNDSPLADDQYRVLLLEQADRLDQQVHNQTPELTVCRYGRVHTAVTRLPVSLRRCLSFEGQPLVGIDLSNSQPLFAGLAAVECCSCRVKKHRLNQFKPSISEPYGRNFGATAPTNPRGPGTPQQPPPITMAEKSQTAARAGGYGAALCNAPDLNEYLNRCEQGEFYESLMLEGEDRDWIKRRTLVDSFYSNGRYESLVRDRFNDKYPTVAGMLTDLKKHDYRRPSWVMQNREATMFIGRIACRIMVEKPDIPLTTINDSFLTTEEHADYIHAVAMDEFSRLGVTPTFKRETYD